MKYYHVTPKDNLGSILRDGLVPQIGPRSSGLETEPLVFLFHNEEDVDNALMGWLGIAFEHYGEDEIAVLEVNLPDNFELEHTDAGYELCSRDVIPSEHLKCLRYE